MKRLIKEMPSPSQEDPDARMEEPRKGKETFGEEY